MDKNYLELVRYRESMYRFFASIYIEEVNREMLDKLLVIRLPKIMVPKESWQMDFNSGYEMLEKYLENYKDKNDDEITEMLDYLASDYAKTFLAAGEADGRAAFPYESVYTGHDSKAGGSVRDQLHALYMSKGLKTREDMFRIYDDHIGLEFNYMAELLAVQAVAISEDNEAVAKESQKEQVKFFKDHLLKWTVTFTNDIYKYSTTDFYRGIARMTSGFLGFEQSVLKDKELK